jgi:hypothetical protein
MEKEVEKEDCIYCGKETEVPVNTPVDLRENYVDGAGQLCPQCFKKIYDEK